MSHSMTLDLLEWVRMAESGSSVDIGADLQLRMDYDAILIMRRGHRIEPAGFRLIPPGTDVVIDAETPYAQFGLRIQIVSDRRQAAGREAIHFRDRSAEFACARDGLAIASSQGAWVDRRKS